MSASHTCGFATTAFASGGGSPVGGSKWSLQVLSTRVGSGPPWPQRLGPAQPTRLSPSRRCRRAGDTELGPTRPLGRGGPDFIPFALIFCLFSRLTLFFFPLPPCSGGQVKEKTATNMVSLKLQKRLAASVLKCGKGRIWMDPSEVNEYAFILLYFFIFVRIVWCMIFFVVIPSCSLAAAR